jgi:hypothetical protein
MYLLYYLLALFMKAKLPGRFNRSFPLQAESRQRPARTFIAGKQPHSKIVKKGRMSNVLAGKNKHFA